MANHTHWLIADNLHCTLPDGRTLFRNVELSLGPRITALIGENGSGKSTLAAQLAGVIQSPPSATIRRHGNIGYLTQQSSLPETGMHLADFLGIAPLLGALKRIGKGEGNIQDFETVEGAWGYPARLASLLTKVGLPPLDPFARIDSMSGGELARLALLRVLLEQPDHLILDEPGNHLDRAGRAELIELLSGFTGGILLITHDRQLLELADTLLDLGPLGLRRYSGGYSRYREQRRQEREKCDHEIDAERRRLQKQHREAQRNLEKHQRRQAVGKAARQRGDQSRLLLNLQAERSERTEGRLRRLAENQKRDITTRLAKMHALHDPEGQARLTLTDIPVGGGAGPILHAESIHFRYHPSQPLVEALSLQIAPGERLELRGSNGSGKSTLLKLLSGELSPQQGVVHRRQTMARLDQHLSVLSPERDALANFRRLAPGLGTHDYYARLAAMGLPHQRVSLPSRALSGGERVRLALSCLLLGPQPAQLLLLDEPTNHLDLVATEALESALQAYPGALIVISHDDRFLTQIGVDRIIEMPEKTNQTE